MSNTTDPMNSDPRPANNNASPELPQTPEQVMQAATARIAELEAELAEMKERWLRAEAETANVRARSHREVNETRQYAVQKFAQDVVEAADNLHRGLDSLPAGAEGEPEIVTRLREGLDGIERNFLNILERNGIKREDPTGAPFDPNLHQAIAEVPGNGKPPGSIVDVVQTGFMIGDRLLRPAMVTVARRGDIPPPIDAKA